MNILVEIDQKSCFSFVERTEEVGVVVEVWGALVGTHESDPMLMLPALLITDFHIAGELLAISSFDGDCQGKAIGY